MTKFKVVVERLDDFMMRMYYLSFQPSKKDLTGMERQTNQPTNQPTDKQTMYCLLIMNDSNK
jgi:hypothetical protein